MNSCARQIYLPILLIGCPVFPTTHPNHQKKRGPYWIVFQTNKYKSKQCNTLRLDAACKNYDCMYVDYSSLPPSKSASWVFCWVGEMPSVWLYVYGWASSPSPSQIRTYLCSLNLKSVLLLWTTDSTPLLFQINTRNTYGRRLFQPAKSCSQRWDNF